jgi:hypothetical protein
MLVVVIDWKVFDFGKYSGGEVVARYHVSHCGLGFKLGYVLNPLNSCSLRVADL